MKKQGLLLIILLILPSTFAATLEGSIYNDNLEPEQDVLVEITTTPTQKYLSKNGTYSFSLPPGKYQLTARKGATSITEEITIISEGIFRLDLFLLSDLSDENDLWQDTETDYFNPDSEVEPATSTTTTTTHVWPYLIAAVLFLIASIRFLRVRRKYGPLKIFRHKVKAEQQKNLELHKEEISKEPKYLEDTIAIIQKYDGRISQKQLRKEMLHLSEAKISLIVTELEHKGIVEKVKKGRGNVLFLRKTPSNKP